ncbi:cell wall metabolism sensor histidine kinase WalK [Fructobacillus sp. M158]|uniref:ATP-binding protein n=1 Tax=Fructobacillus parabroussonetiae TaxID=2713174 RepID=UPI002009DD62|nr:ATP-binding protein [Fructobacillus parabroussonetiae]MCK8617911.1 cell wall metabolism sensor histidine kinase WalK [Fructobacillus parabroussonetiae]
MNFFAKTLQSIRFRLSLVFVLFFVVLFESVGIFFVHQIESSDLVTSADRLTMPTYIQGKIVRGLTNPTDSSAKNTMDTSVREFDDKMIDNVVVFDMKGNIVSDQNGLTKTSNRSRHLDTNTQLALKSSSAYRRVRTNDGSNGQEVIVTTPLKNGKQTVGAVVVYGSLHEIYTNARRVMWLFILAGILTVLAAIYLGFILSRTVTKPIEQIAKQTARITAGDYAMVNKIAGSNEIATLAQSVNVMSQKIASSTEMISNEKNRLYSVLHHMTDGVLLTDARGRLTIINQAASDYLKVNEYEALGQPVFDVLDMPEYQNIRDLIKSKEPFTMDLGERIIEVRISMIKDPSGMINALILILHDVTLQLKTEADRKNFVSNVSHELRTPLTSVTSYVEALADGAKDNPETLDAFLLVIQNETDRMTRMVSDLLELSRIDQGTMELKTELVNLNAMVNFVLNRFDMILKTDNTKHTKHPLHIVRHILDEELWADVDHDKIMQVLDNLLNNAFKYSPDGGTITVGLDKVGDKARVSVSDQGLGIPLEDQKQVFNCFFRVDKSRSRAMGGTGLGLAISKEVIETLGGKIWVESKEGVGSTFYFELDNVDDDLLSEDTQWDE